MEVSVKEDQSLKTIVHSFYEWEKSQPDTVFLRQPVGDNFVDITWGEAGRQARIMATYLNSLGLPPKSNIGLISKNCAHWLIADMAILISGHVSVPFFATLTGPQLQQVLEHSGCQVLFVGKLDGWDVTKSGVPAGVRKIAFPNYIPEMPSVDDEAIQWKDVLANYTPIVGNPVPDLSDLYTIVYTSGTTGTPKGVMTTFDAMSFMIVSTRARISWDIPGARFFSYLPLCHMAERMVVEVAGIVSGGTIYFAESLDTFAQNLAAARPTHFLAVPRIWTKFQQGVLAKIPQRKLDILLRIPVLSKVIKRKIRKGLGLEAARFTFTGAAAMPTALTNWFRRLGIYLEDNYGMTENFGAVSLTPAGKNMAESGGRLYDGVEVRIDPVTGEVLTRSRGNMLGYYRAPALTALALQDGWLYTGDVGELTTEGYLKLTGRVKEIFKGTKGEYIAPSQIEIGFADNYYIDQVCVTGQQLPQPIALIVLTDAARNADKIVVNQSLEQTLGRLNQRLHTYERVKKLVVVKDAWTVENNLMTPTMKMKRNVIDVRYGYQYEPWYEEQEIVVWE